MSNATKDYFRGKKSWSKTKDSLLRCYLPVYFAKLSKRPAPIYYFDGFAGQGVFGDGSVGSPVIALDECAMQLGKLSTKADQVHFLFAEKRKDRRERLETNLVNLCHGYDYAIYPDYEYGLNQLIKAPSYASVLAYVDPCGIAQLDFGHVEKIRNRFDSSEILLNFCSPGLLREIFCVMKMSEDLPHNIDYGNEELMQVTEGYERDARLSRILHGDWWKEYVSQYSKEAWGYWDLEKRISDRYCKELSKCYKYVLNMPIADGSDGVLKYRMIHMTNHRDGCICMNDNMIRRKAQHAEQMALFETDIEGELLSDTRDTAIAEMVQWVINDMPSGKAYPLGEIVAHAITAVGVVYKSSEFARKFLASFEADGTIRRIDGSRQGWSDMKSRFIKVLN